MTPEGGPKDVKPPVLVSSFPPNLSVNYKEQDIRITFNKYIQLKDQYNQVTISPPPATLPQFKVKGKSLFVEFEDSLLRNNTYSIDFGSSIEDITESNPIRNFRFVFSTGSYIDSLSLNGKVINAFDNVPQKDVLAMLYARINDSIPIDSLPYRFKPVYLSKTRENGKFVFENLRTGPLLLFAMKDQNGNGFFDMPNEQIAFCDSLVSAAYIPVRSADTGKQDSASIKKQIVQKDSLRNKQDEGKFYTLRLFEEVDSVQKIQRAYLAQKDQVNIVFRFPVHDVTFKPLSNITDPDWAIREFNPGRDTVTLWLKPNSLDSLMMEISLKEKILDTVRISLLDKSAKKRKEKKAQESVQRLLLTSSTRSGNLNHYLDNPQVVFSYPVMRYDFSRILLVCDNDTLHPVAVFTDSVKRTLTVKHKWKEDKKYRLIFPDSTFYSMAGLTNDTVFQSFKTQSLRDLGSIKINLTSVDSTHMQIIQLLNEKENVLDRRLIKGNGKVYFGFLEPGRYRIKCILDRNGNGRWDTGHYRTKLQPEEVFYFSSVIEVRANWDIEELWRIEREKR